MSCHFLWHRYAVIGGEDIEKQHPFKHIMGVSNQLYSLQLPPSFNMTFAFAELWRIKKHYKFMTLYTLLEVTGMRD